MVTIRDVAKAADVSLSTVSRVLNNSAKVDEPAKSRVLEAVSQLGYRPNVLAKALKEGKTNTIAFVIPNMENMIYPTLAIAVEEEARAHGYFVLFANTREDFQREAEYISRLKGSSVDGFLFSTGFAGKESREILALEEAHFPTVCLMREVEGVSSVVSENYQGAYLGTKYLLEQGHREIAVLHGRLNVALYKQRLAGHLDALKDAGIPIRESYIWSAVDGNSQRAAPCVLAQLEAGNIPQAIFALSDPLAIETIVAAGRFGLQVPKDISILGFDNMVSADHYDLTTIEQPLHKMAQAATRKLIAMIQKKNAVESTTQVFPTQLIVRGSVREQKK